MSTPPPTPLPTPTHLEGEVPWLRDAIVAGEGVLNVPCQEQVDGCVDPEHQDDCAKGELIVDGDWAGDCAPLDAVTASFKL